MSAKKIKEVVKSFTALVKAKPGSEAAISKVRESISSLQKEDSDFVDPVFQDACNELAATVAFKVSVAGGDEAKNPPSIASGMAHTGENPYRKASSPDPVTGSSPKDSAGDADPEHDHTPKKPQPTISGAGNAGTGAKPGDTTMSGSGLSK